MNNTEDSNWFDDYAEGVDDLQVEEYDITASPNDFNVMTLHSFVESGAVRIPGFQRNFVWDLGRASKLIESLILGLPVPQLFLYEQARNRFLVIDGQQRLMSIYYFIKKRFPRKEKRVELRAIFDREGRIPDEILHEDEYFQTFNLRLPERLPNHENKFKGLNYATLGEYKAQFDLRPIRNIVVKQNAPSGDDSSMYEVFNRLNSGGINLRPQEIRTSMYHSAFYEMLYHINAEPGWRKILQWSEPDLHMKDIEILLRGFAMLIDGEHYAPSMVKFLNQFSKKCETHDAQQNTYLRDLFFSFLGACHDLPDDAFVNKKNKRFNIALFEAIFSASCERAFGERRPVAGELQREAIEALETDEEFLEAALEGTTRTVNVQKRLSRAREIVGAM
ncbi:MAG: hypothetical protein B7X04_01465 [Parcubacteria group bacterium 21-54-25]|nr:MAG: hypothetical protein B7X04_01465 [Parcubacteria group bacterium 21-54-25]HQU07595.1 DUF262 domain-containing protein [Candidatus Paceibacterota bacterium]